MSSDPVNHPFINHPFLKQNKTRSLDTLEKASAVLWRPWGGDALALAKEAGKPILLSIHCQTSHWCRRMHEQVFSDESVAEVLNSEMICILVDRDERPDLDEAYQLSHQILTGRTGGWPLTAFLCPETNLPFYIGTYFSLEASGDRLPFQALLEKVVNFFHEKQDRLAQFCHQLNASFEQVDHVTNKPVSPKELDGNIVLTAVDNLLRFADTHYGGFGKAPKFAMPFHLNRLLQAHKNNLDFSHRSGRHVHLSLTVMAKSGLRDLLGGGFFRYSTDNGWNIPHFEKMLYDNAHLLVVYAEASLEFQSSLFKETALSIVHWILSDMTNGEGAFYGSMFADNPEGEGGYYCWNIKDLKRFLSVAEFSVMSVLCGWQGEPNFKGLWHLQMLRRKQDVERLLGLSEDTITACYRSATAKLLRVRQSRQSPVCKDKILCASNALAARGLTMVGRLLAQPHCVKAAERCLAFLQSHCWKEPLLAASYDTQSGSRANTAFLEDFVYLMDALWEHLQSHWDDRYYFWLLTLADQVIEQFGDGLNGFSMSSEQHERIIYQVKPWYDRVTPSANGIAAKVFIRLGYLTGERKYWQVGERILCSAWPLMNRHPELHDSLLQALTEYKNPMPHVLMKGQFSMEWRRALVRLYGTQVHIFACQKPLNPPNSEDMTVFSRLQDASAQLCIGFQRQQTTKSLSGLLALLKALGLKAHSKR